uniref:PAS domain-containing protein n=1 Tax=Glycine max TaxID=3847 RepID=A0A0R0JTJ5_SOYBN
MVDELLDELGFTITDPSIPGHPIVFANPSFLKLTGYSLREVLGWPAAIFSGPLTSQKFVILLNYHRDGMPFWMLFCVSPIFSSDGGAVVHFIVVQREESCEASDDEKRSVVTAMDCIFSVLTHYGEATGRLVCRKRSSIPDVGLLSTSLIISLGRIKQSFVLTNPHLPDMPTVYASDTLLNLTGFKVVTLYKLDQVQMNLLIFSHSS